MSMHKKLSSLLYWTAATWKSVLYLVEEPTRPASYQGVWVGQADLSGRTRISCQQFIDVFSPIGRTALIGICGLVLAENNVPFDWTAFLLPLMHAETFSSPPDFADPRKIRRNREFMRNACAPGSTLTFEYSDPSEDQVFSFSNPFLVSEPQRKQEILEILDFIEHKDPYLPHAALLLAMQESLFSTPSWIATRLGHREWFQQTFDDFARQFMLRPREIGVTELLRHKVDGDRLIEVTSQERKSLALPVKYDVFFSHFHGDFACADALLEAITKVLGSPRIFRTKATEEEQRLFERHPTRFLEAARQSRCIVYLATPNSLGRVFVKQELGNNALRPIFTLLVGVDREDFEQQRRRELYVAYQGDKIYDLTETKEWNRFMADLVKVTGTSGGGPIPMIPILMPGLPSKRTEQEEGDSFVEWRQRLSPKGGVTTYMITPSSGSLKPGVGRSASEPDLNVFCVDEALIVSRSISEPNLNVFHVDGASDD